MGKPKDKDEELVLGREGRQTPYEEAPTYFRIEPWGLCLLTHLYVIQGD